MVELEQLRGHATPHKENLNKLPGKAIEQSDGSQTATILTTLLCELGHGCVLTDRAVCPILNQF